MFFDDSSILGNIFDQAVVEKSVPEGRLFN